MKKIDSSILLIPLFMVNLAVILSARELWDKVYILFLVDIWTAIGYMRGYRKGRSE